MKVGVISRGSPDYLIDIVTDGLIRLLGRSSVAVDYNVRFGSDSKGSYQHLCRGLSGPEPFDIHDADLLIASDRSIEAARRWKTKAKKSKIGILDGEDGSGLNSAGVSLAKVYFKREYLSGTRYAAKVRPLPFAAIPEEMPPEMKRAGVFYSGAITHHFRKEIVEALASMGLPGAPRQDKAAYNRKLREASIGVAIRGCGWDTYRYWEIPYFGAALLAQRTGHIIPDNFRDGEEAVFYGTAAEFRTKLGWMMQHPEETARIGIAGQKAITDRHLSIHRAKTVLESLS